MSLRTCRVCGLKSDDLNLFVKHASAKYEHENLCLRCKQQQTSLTYKARREYVNVLKSGKPCSICGQTFPSICMDFHHITPDNKDGNVGEMIRDHLSMNRILQEIDKCMLVCSNCHRILHQDERDKNGNEIDEDEDS